MCKRIILFAALFASIAGACNHRPQTKEELFSAGTRELGSHNAGTAVIYFKNALEKDQNYTEARFQLGKAYCTLGKYDAAEKELQKVLLQRPRSREAQIELARAYALSGKPADALQALSRIENPEDDADALEISGWAHALKEDYETAAAQLKKAMAADPGRSRTAYLLARVYLLAGAPAEAREQVAELLKKEASNREALYLLAEIQARQKDWTGAIQTCDGVIEKFPGGAAPFFRKGLLLLDMRRYAEVLDLAELLIRKFPSQAEGYQLKGIALFEKKNYKEAVSLLQKALAFTGNMRICYLVGLCHFYNGELEQAMNQAQRALGLNPDFAQARILSALIYLKKNKSDEAIAEIKKVLAAHEQHAAAHTILGSAYLARGQYSEGLASLNRALEIDPALVDARIKKGVFELSQGRMREAENDLRAAVRANPDLLNARLLLASHYLKQNETAKASATAREGIRDLKTDCLLYNIIADAALRDRKTPEAMHALEKAKAADPAYAPTYFKMAALHQLSGDAEKGFALLKAFAESSPENARAQLAVAAALEARGFDREASAYYERAGRTGTPEGAIETARYFLRSGKADKAIALLEESHRKNPDEGALSAAKGLTYASQKKFGYALQAFEELSKREPESGLAAVINTYFAMNKPDKALERVRREMKGRPDQAGLRAQLSRVYIRMGRYKEAAENARRIIEQQPGSGLGYMTLAAVYQSANEPDKAVEVLRAAPRTNDVKVVMMLGNLYAAGKNYAAALSEYQKAEAVQAGYVPAIFQKASTLHLLGKKSEAIAQYQRVLKLSPDHVPALNNLAYLHAEDRDPSAALQYAVHAYVLAPRDGQVQDTLGFALLKNGRLEEGLKTLKQAAATASDNPSIYYHLALALKEHKEPKEAAAYLRKALALGAFPEFAQAGRLLSRLDRETTEPAGRAGGTKQR